MSLRYAYNTNGAANHRLGDAIDLIARAGYAGVALTLDHHHLDPFADGWAADAGKVARHLGDLGLGHVVGEVAQPVWGTEGFVAPEVVLGADLGPPADVYALGALGWLCLSGEVPGPPGVGGDIMRWNGQNPRGRSRASARCS